MMSPTTSFGRPFSAESCANPVTSSRFMATLPLLQFRRQKKWGRPTFPGTRGRRQSPLTCDNYTKAVQTSEEEGPPSRLLGEVVPDVREEVGDLVFEKNCRDDQEERDDGDDQ